MDTPPNALDTLMQAYELARPRLMALTTYRQHLNASEKLVLLQAGWADLKGPLEELREALNTEEAA